MFLVKNSPALSAGVPPCWASTVMAVFRWSGYVPRAVAVHLAEESATSLASFSMTGESAHFEERAQRATRNAMHEHFEERALASKENYAALQ